MTFKLIFASLAFAMAARHAVGQTNEANPLEYYITHAPFKMAMPTEPKFSNKTFNITDYGAIGDGQTLNTAAIAKAITACNAAGGGTVLIPAGLWLTGPIQLKSNVNLHAVRGALITFSTDHTQYPMVDGHTTPLLSGNKLENLGVTGEGIYDGGGDTWRPLKKMKAAPSLWADLLKSGGVVSSDGSMYWPTKAGMTGEDYLKTLKGRTGLTENDYLPARDFLRPPLITITNSKNILIEGATFKNSPQFALNPKNCNNMVIRNVTINNEYSAQNGDGIDLSSCKNTVVFHCTVNAGDDGICMKSSGNKEDPDTAPGLENIIVADCIVNHAHGGFVIGSNTDGGMRNVYVTNCNFVNTDVGIRVKSSRGRGGLVHDIHVSNIYMLDILNEAILFDTHYEDANKDAVEKMEPVNARTPRFQDFDIDHIYCSKAKAAIAITGLPEMPVNHIRLSDIVIAADNAVSITDAADISFKNVKVLSPKPTLISVNNAQNISVENMAFTSSTSTFLTAKGVNTKGITVSRTDLKGLADPFKFNDGLSKSIIIVQ
jgi:polygalacturonase